MTAISTKPIIHLVLRALIVLGALSSPAIAYGALVNINTADIAALDELPGIGPSKAASIVEYREANGPFSVIEDIKKVSGIGDTTFTDIKNYITVGESNTNATSTQGTQSDTATSQSTVPKIETITQYEFRTVEIEPPRDIYVRVPERIVAVERASVLFEAELYDARGRAVEGASVYWSFGDGASYEGRKAVHRYAYIGEYMASVRAESGPLSAEARIGVSIVPLAVAVSYDVNGKWVQVENNSQEALNLSGWRLHTGMQYFIVPEGTFVAPGASVRFASDVTKLSTLGGTQRVFLIAPDGETVADSAESAEIDEEEESMQEETEESTTASLTQNEETASVAFLGGDAPPPQAAKRPAGALVGTALAGASRNPAPAPAAPAQEKPAEPIRAASTDTQTSAAASATAATPGNPLLPENTAPWWLLGLGALLATAALGAVLVKESAPLADSFEIIEDTSHNKTS